MGLLSGKAALAGVAAIVSTAAVVEVSKAAAVTNEPFNYVAGTPVLGQTPSGYIDEWSLPSNFTAGHSVASSGLSYSGMPSSGNALTLQGATASERLDFPATYFNYDDGAGSTAPNGVFFSFLMKVAMTPGTSTAENYFAGMNYYNDNVTSGTPQGWGGMMFIRRGTGGDDPNTTYEIGIVKNNRAAGNVALTPTAQTVPAFQIGWDPVAHDSTETLLVVGQYKFNTRANISDDTVNLWVNPSLNGVMPASPTATTSTGSDVYTASGNPSVIANLLNSFLFRSTSSNWPGVVTVDELRVGLDYSDVVVPEPTGLAVLAVGALGALGRRRRSSN